MKYKTKIVRVKDRAGTFVKVLTFQLDDTPVDLLAVEIRVLELVRDEMELPYAVIEYTVVLLIMLGLLYSIIVSLSIGFQGLAVFAFALQVPLLLAGGCCVFGKAKHDSSVG